MRKFVCGHKNIRQNVCQYFLVIFFLFVSSSLAAKASAVSDIDSDSCPDLITTNASNQLVVQHSDCSGNLTATSVISLSFNTTNFDMGDINQDGLKDLVSLSDAGDLLLALHDQSGSFLSEISIPHGLQPTESIADIKLAYVNDDSLLDLVVIVDGLINGRVLLFYGNGAGGFNNAVEIDLLSMLSVGQSIQVGTVDNNDTIDLIVRDVLGQVYVLLADGLGAFDSPIIVPGLLPIGSVSFADYNHDGYVDMLVLDELLGVLNVRLGNGDGTFATGTSVMVGLTPVDMVSVDINSDGDQDAVVVNIGDNSINVLLGDGTGNLVDLVGPLLDDLLGALPVLNMPAEVVTVDLSGDCVPDLAVWNDISESYTVVINQSGPDIADLVFCAGFEVRF